MFSLFDLQQTITNEHFWHVSFYTPVNIHNICYNRILNQKFKRLTFSRRLLHNLLQLIWVFRHEMVWMVLRAENMHSLHLQNDQLQSDTDYSLYVKLVRWMLVTAQNDSRFPTTVLFPNDPCCTREGAVNKPIAHIWSSENPHRTVLSKE